MLPGLNNVVVVETPDAVLVADKSRTQDVKKVVAELKAQNRSIASAHRKVHRPGAGMTALTVVAASRSSGLWSTLARS